MNDKAHKRELARRLAFVVAALPEGMTFLDWYDNGAEVETLTNEAGEDWIIESVSHSWGFLEGAAFALNVTPLELLDEYDIKYGLMQKAADATVRSARSRTST